MCSRDNHQQKKKLDIGLGVRSSQTKSDSETKVMLLISKHSLTGFAKGCRGTSYFLLLDSSLRKKLQKASCKKGGGLRLTPCGHKAAAPLGFVDGFVHHALHTSAKAPEG